MPIPEEIITTVAATNLKNVGEAPAFYSGLAMQDAVADQRAMSAIRQAATGAIVKQLVEVDPVEAISALKATTGNDLAQQIAQLVAALSTNAQGAKVAWATPQANS